MKELWKDVIGWEECYMVSNKGRVKSKDRFVYNPIINGMNLKEGKILKPIIAPNGYLRVHLRDAKNKRSKNCLIHRLVAEAFIDNKENKPQIDHINTIRSDNRVENLRWCTSKENHNNETTLINHGKASEGRIMSEKQKQAIRKYRYKKVYCIELDKTYDSYCIAEEELGLTKGSINCYLRKTAYKNGIKYKNMILNFRKVGE